MIVKNGNTYQVKSKTGDKNLSKPGLSKKEAEKRLRQVEYFKAHKAKRGAGTFESLIILALFVAVGCCLLRCTPTQVLPIKAAAQEVVTNCPLDITVRECLHRLIDDVAHDYSQHDGGTR